MAVAFVRNHQARNINSASINNLAVGIDASNDTVPGSTLIARITFDNTNATTPTVSSIAKMSGETASWVLLKAGDSSSATSAAGVRTEVWGIITTVVWTANTTYTITLSGSVSAKACTLQEFSGATTTLRGTAGSGTSTGGTPTASTSGTALVTGDLAIGAAGFESNAAATGDADTTNGSWSTVFNSSSSGGGSAANATSAGQYKIVTATGVQTYNPTGASDSNSVVLALVPQLVANPTADNAGLTDSVTVTKSTVLDFSDLASSMLDGGGNNVLPGTIASFELDTDADGLADGWRFATGGETALFQAPDSFSRTTGTGVVDRVWAQSLTRSSGTQDAVIFSLPVPVDGDGTTGFSYSVYNPGGSSVGLVSSIAYYSDAAGTAFISVNGFGGSVSAGATETESGAIDNFGATCRSVRLVIGIANTGTGTVVIDKVALHQGTVIPTFDYTDPADRITLTAPPTFSGNDNTGLTDSISCAVTLDRTDSSAIFADTFTGTNGAALTGWTCTAANSGTAPSYDTNRAAFTIASASDSQSRAIYATQLASDAYEAVMDFAWSTVTPNAPVQMWLKASGNWTNLFGTGPATGYGFGISPTTGVPSVLSTDASTAPVSQTFSSIGAMTATTVYRMRGQVVPVTSTSAMMRVKVWDASGAEPSAWSGEFLMTGLGATTGNYLQVELVRFSGGPATAYIDNVTVARPSDAEAHSLTGGALTFSTSDSAGLVDSAAMNVDKATSDTSYVTEDGYLAAPQVSENFTGTNGATPSGWTTSINSTGTLPVVNSNKFRFAVSGTSNAGSRAIKSTSFVGDGQEVSFTFQTDGAHNTLLAWMMTNGAWPFAFVPGAGIGFELYPGNGSMTIYGVSATFGENGDGTVGTPIGALTVNTDYRVRLQAYRSGTITGFARLKVWLASSGEPSAWNHTVVIPANFNNAAWGSQVQIAYQSQGFAQTLDIDDLTVTQLFQVNLDVGDGESDTTGLTDAEATAATIDRSDTTGLTDSVSTALGLGRDYTDVAAPTDTSSRAVTLDRSDIAAPTDVASKAVTVDRSDNAAPTDAASEAVALDRSDNAVPTDTASPVLSGTDYTLDKSDTVGLVDTDAETVALDRSDTTGLVDVEIDDDSLSASDNTGLTDSATVDRAVSAADSTGLTDSATSGLGLGRSYSDTAGLVDAPASSVDKTSSDTTGLTDTATSVRGLSTTPATDNTGLTDSRSIAVGEDNSDTANLTDSVSLVIQASRQDSTGLTDTATTGGNQAITTTDTAGLTDTAASTVDRALTTDGAGISDASAEFVSLDRSDSAGVTDVAATAAVSVRSASDVTGLVDTVELTLARTVSDQANLTDATSLDRAVVAADLENLTDSFDVVLVRAYAASDDVNLVDAVSFAMALGLDVTDVVGSRDTFTVTGGVLIRIGKPGLHISTPVAAVHVDTPAAAVAVDVPSAGVSVDA